MRPRLDPILAPESMVSERADRDMQRDLLKACRLMRDGEAKELVLKQVRRLERRIMSGRMVD